MAWFASGKDFAKESGNQKNYMTKTKLPTGYKSQKWFCRNCLKQIANNKKPCPYCGVKSQPLKKRK
jgi:rubrerythrin